MEGWAVGCVGSRDVRCSCNRLKILNFNSSINYSEFSIQISDPLIIHFKPSLIPKPFPTL